MNAEPQGRFAAPFPWTIDDWAALLGAFKQEGESLTVKWWWEPFHRTGFQALRLRGEKNLDRTNFEIMVENLSCPAPTKNLEKKFGALGLLDEDGRIRSLDPKQRIQNTMQVAGFLDRFEGEKPLLPRIQDLRRELAATFASWRPQIQSLEEYATVSNWLTKGPGLMKRFQNLGPWEQLEVVETLVGPLISSSEVNFVRVYLKS